LFNHYVVPHVVEHSTEASAEAPPPCGPDWRFGPDHPL